MNCMKCETTNFSPAYLNFARELRSPDEVQNDLRAVVQSENFIPQITPYLDKMAMTLTEAKSVNEKHQDRQKFYADKNRRPSPKFHIGDKVWVGFLHTPKSNAEKGVTSKFDPKRDGPYVIVKEVSPTSYQVAGVDSPEHPLGTYHVSVLTPIIGAEEAKPIVPIRRRGRPRRKKRSGVSN
ncbi:hypothetical protein NQ317_000612 [Molorchus minor]|uniref:Uncharacterized protein n=1 Tax=Molorchus minor TaxID=1323400 RepID=A0ABQ9JQE4_9CUCU|nr:hypothetical protein NQ317_000612 [Molorchus minor]